MRSASLQELRDIIRDIEAHTPNDTAPDGGEKDHVWSLGLDDVDEALPGRQLSCAAFHDIAPAHPADTPAALGFALALLSRLPRHGDILWCQSLFGQREYGRLYGPGIGWFGLCVERLIQVNVRSKKDLAWVTEEAVRSGGLAGVISEDSPLSFTATRRLALACQQNQTPCLFINLTTQRQTSAAATRWEITALPSPRDNFDHTGMGISGWSVHLKRSRGGMPRHWHLHWNHETYRFHLAAALRPGEISADPKSTADIFPLQRRA